MRGEHVRCLVTGAVHEILLKENFQEKRWAGVGMFGGDEKFVQNCCRSEGKECF